MYFVTDIHNFSESHIYNLFVYILKFICIFLFSQSFIRSGCLPALKTAKFKQKIEAISGKKLPQLLTEMPFLLYQQNIMIKHISQIYCGT